MIIGIAIAARAKRKEGYMKFIIVGTGYVQIS
jgi:hypothetical protein